MRSSRNGNTRSVCLAIDGSGLHSKISLFLSGRTGVVLLAILYFSLCLASPTALAQGDPEPNNTPSQALPLILPFNSAGGVVSSYEDRDYYKFSAQAGQEITIWLVTATMNSSLKPILAFYDNTGKLLAYNDDQWNIKDSCYCGDALLYLTIPSTGTYYIAVTSAARFRNQSSNELGTSGPYELYLLTTFGTMIEDGFEPNNSISSALPIDLPFNSLHTNLIYLGDMDWFYFSAKRGQRITVDIDALENKSKPGWNLVAHTRLGIFDQGGQLLSVSDGDEDPTTGFAGDPALLFEAPRDGIYFIAVTAAADTQFIGLLRNADFLKDPYVDSKKDLLGSYTLSVHLSYDLHFSQIANGSFGDVYFATSLILVNSSSTDVEGKVDFFQPNGTPLLTSFVPSIGDPTSTYRFSIQAGGSTLITTDGMGPGNSGYAIVTASSSLGGTAVFSQYTASGDLMTEAAVGTAPPIEFFSIPVDVTGDFNTGIAIANTLKGAPTANIQLRLLDSQGVMAGTRTLTLNPGSQVSEYVSGPGQLFPGVTNFRGSLQVLSDAPVSAVALRISSQTLTTLEPVPLNQTFQPVTLLFPHVVAGSNGSVDYRSHIVLTNTGYFPVGGSIEFTRSDGSPMPVTLGAVSSAIHSFLIPPQGTLFLETASAGALSTGYATIDADHGIGGSLIYSQFETSSGKLQAEVGVSPGSNQTSFIVFAQNEDGFNTGIAVANLNPGDADIEYTLLSDSGTIETTTALLGSGKQTARLVAGDNQLFPSFTGRGTLKLVSNRPLAAVALRLTSHTMTALPVIPIP